MNTENDVIDSGLLSDTGKTVELISNKGYQKRYSSSFLFIGFFIINMMGNLPDPLWLVSFLSFTCVIPPLKAYNYAIRNSDNYSVIERPGFNTRQIVLLIIGIVFMGLVVLGLWMPAEDY